MRNRARLLFFCSFLILEAPIFGDECSELLLEEEEEVASRDSMKDTLYDRNEREIRREERDARLRSNYENSHQYYERGSNLPYEGSQYNSEVR